METKPAEVYQNILKTTPPDLGEKVLAILKQHRGKKNKISRRALILKLFGVYVDSSEDLSRNPLDRQIRREIAALAERYPILSSSGEGGYWWPDSVEEINCYMAEIESRARRLFEKSAALRRAAIREFGPQMSLPLGKV